MTNNDKQEQADDKEDVEQSNQSDDNKEHDEQSDEEEVFTEEELEIEREIESYTNKIEKLDARLHELKSEKLDKLKEEQMRQRGYSDKHIERYRDHVKGETEDEIKRSVMELSLDIPPVDNSTDPAPLNYARPKQKSKIEQAEEVGKRQAERVLPRIFPGLKK